MRYFGTKSKYNRSIAGISGILLLLFGVLSLVFQSSTNVQVYAQPGFEEGDIGPLVAIDGRSQALDSGSDDQDLYVAFVPQGQSRVDLAKVVPGAGGRSGALDGIATVIEPGNDPAIAVTPGTGEVAIVATAGGQIVEVGCVDDEEDCTTEESVSDPGPEIETSCFDGEDNDGDGEIDSDDSDCFACYGGGPDLAGFSGMEARVQFVTNGPICPFEEGVDCDDNIDNDGDGATDAEDPDCGIEGGFLDLGIGGPNCDDGIDNDGDGFTDTGTEEEPGDPGCEPVIGLQGSDTESADAENNDTADAEDTESADAENNDTADVEPTSLNLQRGTSPQLTFVQTDPAPPASNADVAISDDGSHRYVVWEEAGDIMFSASHDGGDTWSEKKNLSNNAGTSREPRVATSSDGVHVHVAWQDNTSGNDEIFYSRSVDQGNNFNGGSPVGSPRNLSNTRGASNDHQLVAEGSNVYVVWVDYTTGNGDIYFKRSNNNGATFNSSPINLSRGSGFSLLASRDPDMAAQGSLVSVIWSVHPDRAARGPGEIIFRESTNNGGSFGSHIVVSKTPRTDSREPQIDYTPEDNERYAAWNDKGGPPRVHTTPGTFNVLASESDNGRTFSAPFNLADAENNPDPGKQTSQLQVIDDVAVWDPTSRRG